MRCANICPRALLCLKRLLRPLARRSLRSCFASYYPKCENISVDYAVLEPRSAKGEHLSHLYCLPAEFSWNDLGSWASLYEYQMETRLRGDGDGNVAESDGHLTLRRGTTTSTARESSSRWSGSKTLSLWIPRMRC